MAGAYGHLQTIGRYWDAVAPRYLELYRHELRGKPYDQKVLREFAEALGPAAAVCDVGCGPCGHITRYLADCGANVVGIDLSPRCAMLARAEQPSLRFEVMDMGAMSFEDCTFDGLVASYVLHYEQRASLQRVFYEFRRVLRPGGRLLIVAKDGDEEGLTADPLGTGRNVFWSALPEDDLVVMLTMSGFRTVSCEGRDPLPDEIPARRIYVCVERPGLPKRLTQADLRE